MAAGGFRAFLLDGVTGSGKTEVYLRLIQAALAAGRQTLVLVPEIGLTPQLERRMGTRLGVPMAVLHSGLGERERELAWRAAASGAAALVLGTRSAVFTPLPRLGLVVVDEEHDGSFKQQDGLRYSARDLAVRRAQVAGCPVVLGSATPALETLHNAERGRYAWLHLTERAGGASPPRLDLLDIRGQPLEGGLSRVLVRDMSRGDRRRQPGPAVPQPARLRPGPDLPRLRLGRRLPPLRRPPDPAPAPSAPGLPPLRLDPTHTAGLSGLRQGRPACHGSGDRTPGGGRRPPLPRGPRRPHRPRQHPRRAACDDCWRGPAGAITPSSSGPRCWPRATTCPGSP